MKIYLSGALALCATTLALTLFFHTPQETRIRVAVVDTGLDLTAPAIKPYLCKNGHKDFTETDLKDRHSHGTNIAYLIAKKIDPSRECLVIVKWLDTYSSWESTLHIYNAIKYASEMERVGYINISAGGPFGMESERQALELAAKRGVKIVVAAGNDGVDLNKECGYFPACYPIDENFYVVGALTDDGQVAYFSNYGDKVVDSWALGMKQNGGGVIMSGTSQATANMTAILIETDRNND